jgi:hypothetical protein
VSDPGTLAHQVDEARGRLLDFVRGCTDEQWLARPLGDADPRSVGVVVDHVADAYEYLARWIAALVRGDRVEVDATVVDDLNAHHAATVTAPTRGDVTAHLAGSGDRIIGLISSLAPEHLAMGDGRVERLAHIAARHADGHRDELEQALGSA